MYCWEYKRIPWPPPLSLSTLPPGLLGLVWGSKADRRMYSTFAWAKLSTEGDFERITIKRNEPGDEDVQFDIG